MTKSEQLKYSGDGQAYLVACHDKKVRQDRLWAITLDEALAKDADEQLKKQSGNINNVRF